MNNSMKVKAVNKKKDKIGVITLNGYFNYGNRLQNYATEQILKKMNFDVETIINKTSEIRNSENDNLSYKIKKLIKMEKKQIYKKIKSRFRYLIYKKQIDQYKIEKRKLFKEFSTKYLNETNYSISKNNIPNSINDEYDYFITGSDQVWNPSNVEKDSSINFLGFAPETKRISLAPSFGVNRIPKAYKEDYKKWLNGIKALSVREYEGAKIIRNLTNREPAVLIDPTMMLNKDEWINISKRNYLKPNNEYILTYILGELSSKEKKEIKKIANTNNLEIVNLAMKNNWSKYVLGPQEFIDYFKTASFIFTDSFHATIFSILFHVPFVTYRRNKKESGRSMISRINTLLSKFDLEDRFRENLVIDNNIFDINYNNIEEVLEKERIKVYNYLNKYLN
jgi:hypothetical protein